MKTKSRSMFNLYTVAAVIAALLGGALSTTPAHAAATCYVNASAAGADTGGSWTDAYTDLQTALNLGVTPTCTTIYVAKGVYKPSQISLGTQTLSFTVRPGQAVYGGFNSGDPFAARDPATKVTVLSGDIDSNDTNKANGVTPTAGDVVGVNSYHVVYMDGVSAPMTGSTVLDGFTLTGGQANSAYPNGFGGGLVCRGGGGACSPTLAQLVVVGNKATNGAGMTLEGTTGTASPTLRDITFRNNAATGGGGAMFNSGYGGFSSPSLTNVTFSGNAASASGGAIYNDGRPSGITPGNSSPTLANVTFSGNSSTNGGAIYNYGAGAGAYTGPVLKNVTFKGNTASALGGAIYNNGSSGGNAQAALTNVILWGDTAPSGPEIYNVVAFTVTINQSVVQGGDSGSNTGTAFSTGAGNLSTDPNLSTLASNGGLTQTIALLAGSSAIGTGDPNVCAAAPVGGYDQRGVSRMACDIGAYQTEVEGVFDDNRAGWTFTGTWMISPSPGAYNNTLHLARSAGATAEYTITAAAGDRFMVTYLRMPGLGSLEIYLDGAVTPLTTIVTNGPAKLLSYGSPMLTAGSHTVKLRRAGAGVVAFDLLEQIVTKADERGVGITYSVGWTNVAVPAAYLGTLKYATVTNATASFGFPGSRFSLTAAKSPGFGNLEVYIDGSLTPLTTLKYGAPAAGFWTYTTPSLGGGAHTVVLKYVSASPNYVALDALVIRP